MAATTSFSYIYKPLFTESARYFDLVGGRGRGGSYAGTNYFLHLITRKDYFRGCFLRQVLGDVRGSLFQEFKDRIDECESATGSIKLSDFDINEGLMTIVYKPTGNMIISKGVTKTSGRTAKLKSLAGVTHVLMEEADEIGREDFAQLDLSLRTVKVPGGVRVIRIFNPPHMAHWIWDDYNLTVAKPECYHGAGPGKNVYYNFTPKSSSGIVSIFSTYYDNVRNLDLTFMDKLESYRKTNPDYYFTVVLGLIGEGMKGRIFSGWQAISNDAYNQVDAKSLITLDFGLASPAGLIEMKFVKNNVYLRELNYEPLTNLEIGIKLCELGILKQSIVADSAEPSSISKLRRGWSMDEINSITKLFDTDVKGEKILKAMYKPLIAGFNIYPATKGPGSVKAGISAVKELTVYATEDSLNLWNEYHNYKWALDKNKDPTDEPIDQFNHLIDPVRYGVKDRVRHY